MWMPVSNNVAIIFILFLVWNQTAIFFCFMVFNICSLCYAFLKIASCFLSTCADLQQLPCAKCMWQEIRKFFNGGGCCTDVCWCNDNSCCVQQKVKMIVDFLCLKYCPFTALKCDVECHWNAAQKNWKKESMWLVSPLPWQRFSLDCFLFLQATEVDGIQFTAFSSMMQKIQSLSFSLRAHDLSFTTTETWTKEQWQEGPNCWLWCDGNVHHHCHGSSLQQMLVGCAFSQIREHSVIHWMLAMRPEWTQHLLLGVNSTPLWRRVTLQPRSREDRMKN